MEQNPSPMVWRVWLIRIIHEAIQRFKMVDVNKPNQIYIGEIFHTPPNKNSQGDPLGCRNLQEVTSGIHGTPVNINKGIFFFKALGSGSNKRRSVGFFTQTT